MRKLLFTLFGLILCTATLLASNSKAPTSKTTTLADFGWENDYKTLSFQAGVNSNDVVVSTETSTNQNGTYKTKNKTWRTYYADSEGPVTLTAGNNMWIKDVSFTLTAGVLSLTKGGTAEFDKTAVVTKAVNGTSKKWYTTSADGGCVGITKVVVNYYQIPNSITLTAGTDVIKVGESTTIEASFDPSTASDSIKWTSLNPEIATVNNNGQVTGVSVGVATIKAIGIDNNVNKTTTITVYPADNTYLKESFSTVNKESGWKTGPDPITGDNGVYNWSMANYNTNYAFGIGLRGKKESLGYLTTDKSYEGGIKSVSFDWQPTTSGAIDFNVQVNSTTVPRQITTEANTTYHFAHSFNTAEENNNLTISQNNSTTFLCFGPISIVPYLLYTQKTATLQALEHAVDSKYTHPIINNTDVIIGAGQKAIVFSIKDQSAETDKIAVIDAETGEVTLKGVGTVTIIATWGQVSTSYTLTIELPTPVISNITAQNMELGSGIYTPTMSATIGGNAISDAQWEYTSSKENIVMVNGSSFVPVATGNSNMKVTLKKGTYQGYAYESVNTGNVAFSVTAYSVEDNISENLSKLTAGSSTGSTNFNGDNDLYKWTAHNHTKTANVNGITIHHDGGETTAQGFLAMNGVQEGGIKYMTFGWGGETTASGAVSFVVTMNGEDYIYSFTSAGKTSGYTWERMFYQNRNCTFSAKVNEGSSKGINIEQITIVPYLLYKTKKIDVDCKTTSSYNLKDASILINNTTTGDVTFTATQTTSGWSGTIENGVLDLKDVSAKEDIKVTATWGDVSTTMTLHVTDAYSAVPTNVLLNVGATMNATEGNKFQIVGTVEPAEANPTITWSSNAEGVVFVDQNGMLDVKSAGEAIITAKDVKGHATSCTITVAATTDETFTEDYSTLSEQADWKSTNTEYAGTLGQLWRVRNYRFSSATELQSGVAGVEIQHTVNTKSVNFVAYANADVEGGVKRVSFDWRAVDGTKPVKFDIDSTQKDANVNLISLPANGGFDQVQSFSRDVNLNQNMQFRIHITDATSTNVVFGPITITPYLLYKAKTVELSPEQCAERGYKYTNTAIINNTGSALANEAISYSISGENNDKIAQLNTATGELSLIGKGTVTVTATWGKVSTSYTLEVTDKLTPTISEFSDTEIDIFGSYAPAPVFKIGDVVLTDAAYTFSSGTSAVASVKDNIFTIRRTGTSVITATLTGTDYYNTISPASTCTLTVTKPTEGAWEETYETFTATSGYKTGNSFKEAGKDNVYQWQLRAYRYGSDKDKVNGENGISLNRGKETNNYIAFNTPYEGGVKDVFFNWQLLGTTNRTAQFTLYNGKSTVIDAYSASATAGKYYSYAHHVNEKSNFMLKIIIPEGGDSIVFGPITIVPYLLYTEKTKEIPLSSEPYTHPIMDNTNGDGTITYAITDGDDDVATINTETGAVTMNNTGTVTVTATWVPSANPQTSVTTSYQLTGGSNLQLETFSGGTQTNKYCDPASQVKARFSDWMCSLSGIRADLNGMTSKAVAMRAPTAEETTAGKSSYIESVVSTAKDAMKKGLSKLALVWNLDKEETGVNWDIRFYVNGRLVRTLTNEDITATTTMASPASIVIDDINEPGTIQIRVENHSTLISGDPITGERACINFDNFEYFPYEAIVLKEGEDNSTLIAETAEAGEPVNVKITRTITSGMYNTFCLPFDVDEDMMAEKFGSDYDLQAFSNAQLSGDKQTVTINFKNVSAMEAGKPYLLKTKANVVNPTFEDVLVENTTGGESGSGIVMKAIMNPTHITPGDHTHMIVIANDQMAWLQQGDESTMKGMRAYFHVENAQMQAALRNAAPRLKANTTNTPTGTENVNANVNANRKMIINDQLIIIREGKRFNAQGALIK